MSRIRSCTPNVYKMHFWFNEFIDICATHVHGRCLQLFVFPSKKAIALYFFGAVGVRVCACVAKWRSCSKAKSVRVSASNCPPAWMQSHNKRIQYANLIIFIAWVSVQHGSLRMCVSLSLVTVNRKHIQWSNNNCSSKNKNEKRSKKSEQMNERVSEWSK